MLPIIIAIIGIRLHAASVTYVRGEIYEQKNVTTE